FPHHSPCRVQRALHPAGPLGSVLAREVNPSLRLRQRLDEADLPRRVQRERAPLPWVEPPAFRDTALERIAELRKDLPCLSQRCLHAIFFTHIFELCRIPSDGIRGQRAPFRGIRPRIGSEPFDREIRRHVSAETTF